MLNGAMQLKERQRGEIPTLHRPLLHPHWETVKLQIKQHDHDGDLEAKDGSGLIRLSMVAAVIQLLKALYCGVSSMH